MAIIKTHFFNISFEHKDLMKMLIKMTEYQDEMFPQDSKKIANNVKGVSVMDEANPYNEPLDNIYHILNRLNLESNVQDNEFKEINLHNANKLIDDINDKIDNIVKIKEDITKEKEENDEAIILLKNLEESKISVDDVKNTKCVERVEAAKAKKLDAQTNMNEKRKEIYDGFVTEQNKKIEAHKAELMNKNKEEAKQLDQDYNDTVANLENLYNQNKDKWINQIVERCLK